MNRSQKAARYGALAEAHAREVYGLSSEHDSWHDHRADDGSPWDSKSAMLSRRDPRFRLWEGQHRKLASNGGGYVFMGYVPRGDGIEVIETRTVRAQDLRVDFYGAGSHPKGNQVKVPVGEVLSV